MTPPPHAADPDHDTRSSNRDACANAARRPPTGAACSNHPGRGPSAARNALTSNKEWGARLVAGRIEEGREFARLSELADQADQVTDAINNTTTGAIRD